MKIPAYWAKDEGGEVDPHGKRFHLRMWGWSSASPADAAQVARDRLRDALDRVRRGEQLGGQYYPRLPLREQTLRTVEQAGSGSAAAAVITRNRYGAEVLNTDLVLIADVDHDFGSPGAVDAGAAVAAGADAVRSVGRRLKRLFAGSQTPLAGQMPAPVIDPAGRAGPEPTTPATSAAERSAVAHVERWAAAHPTVGVRVYRTFAGLRVIVTGADAPPASDRARQILTELDSDPLYVELCVQHETYRARLTPKPWRAGTRSPYQHWPFESPAQEDEFGRWLDDYDRRSQAHATCRFVTQLGPQAAPGSPEAAVIDCHDSATRSTDRLPLA